MTSSSLPVTRAVPSKFHLPAKTAPLCASTLFSMRPALEVRWNFPGKRQKNRFILYPTLADPQRFMTRIGFSFCFSSSKTQLVTNAMFSPPTEVVELKINFAFTINYQWSGIEVVSENCNQTCTLWWPVSKNLNLLCNFWWSTTANQHDAAFSRSYI